MADFRLPDSSNILHWDIYLKGPPASPFKGGVWKISLKFPETYPFKPPQITFETPIYHMNVSEDGKICDQMISEGWSPTLDAAHCARTLYTMLAAPQTSTPLRSDIANLYKENKPKYNAQVSAHVAKNAAKTKVPDA